MIKVINKTVGRIVYIGNSFTRAEYVMERIRQTGDRCQLTVEPWKV